MILSVAGLSGVKRLSLPGAIQRLEGREKYVPRLQAGKELKGENAFALPQKYPLKRKTARSNQLQAASCLVARGGIEPPTQGFSIHDIGRFGVLIAILRPHLFQYNSMS